jgi:hypothetical protein
MGQRALQRVVNSTCTRLISLRFNMRIFIGYYFDKYQMQPQFVTVEFDILSDWVNDPPVYRIFVGGELFTERTFIWRDEYVTELLQISAPPGQYRIKIKGLDTNTAKIRVSNRRVSSGPARWIDDKTLEITDESQ